MQVNCRSIGVCRSSCAEQTASHVEVVTRDASDLHDLVVNPDVGVGATSKSGSRGHGQSRVRVSEGSTLIDCGASACRLDKSDRCSSSVRCSGRSELTTEDCNVTTRNCLDHHQFCVHEEQIVNVQISCGSNSQRGIGAAKSSNNELRCVDCVFKRCIHRTDHLQGAAIQQELCCAKPVLVVVLVGSAEDSKELALARNCGESLNRTFFKTTDNSSNVINCCICYGG